MSAHADIARALKRPFPVSQISWRVGAVTPKQNPTKGVALAYIDARDVMHRLDHIFGLHWQARYSHAEGKTICEIGVKIGDEWVWRAGGAGDTDIEAEKGAISDAFKRAAVLWGIGRYLYDLPNEWVPLVDGKRLQNAPKLPAWATPEGFDALNSKAPAQPALDMSPAARAKRITEGVKKGDAAGAADVLSREDKATLDAIWALLDEDTTDALTDAWPK
jgi:hypothetical protein